MKNRVDYETSSFLVFGVPRRIKRFRAYAPAPIMFVPGAYTVETI